MTTALVPAAGRGTRLGAGTPKALIDVGGKPLVNSVLEAVATYAEEIVIVIQPDHEAQFVHALGHLGWLDRCRLVFQDNPAGTIEAVNLGIQTSGDQEPCVLIWADQVGVSSATISSVVESLVDGFNGLVLPVASVPYPYVWYEVDMDGTVRVGRQRDGDISPATGQTDVGTFGFLVGSAREALATFASTGLAPDRERDFVYAVPRIAEAGGLRLLAVSDREARGVNTPDELDRARRYPAGVQR